VEQERRAAEHFAAAAATAGVRRIVYLGGLVPSDGRISRHLASRLAVEELLLTASPESMAMRAPHAAAGSRADNPDRAFAGRRTIRERHAGGS